MQTPILLSIVEYGIILAMKMYFETSGLIEFMGRKTSANVLFNAIDSFTLTVSIVVLVLFNLAYWLA